MWNVTKYVKQLWGVMEYEWWNKTIWKLHAPIKLRAPVNNDETAKRDAQSKH